MVKTTLDPTVTAELINPILSATQRIFENMLGCVPRRTNLSLIEGWTSKYRIRAVISLSGKIIGTVIFSLPDKTACEIYHRLTDDTATTVNENVIDAVAEVCNMIGGAAKAQLEKYELKLGIPNVIQGDDLVIHFPTYIEQPLSLEFTSDIGDFSIETGFVRN
jgi:chemotaxis protein CheX